MAETYPDVQLHSLGVLINHWRALHGPLPILRHADLDPTRRRDPYQLSTQEIERWAAQATPTPPVSLPTDPFDKWGSIGKPTEETRGYAVPRAWLVNKALGACVQPETYAGSGAFSVTEFTNGLILYFKAKNSTEVVMF